MDLQPLGSTGVDDRAEQPLATALRGNLGHDMTPHFPTGYDERPDGYQTGRANVVHTSSSVGHTDTAQIHKPTRRKYLEVLQHKQRCVK